jgi:hypothetical protein
MIPPGVDAGMNFDHAKRNARKSRALSFAAREQALESPLEPPDYFCLLLCSGGNVAQSDV